MILESEVYLKYIEKLTHLSDIYIYIYPERERKFR